MAAVKETIDTVAKLETYEHGFVTDIEMDFAPKGLNADIVRFISEKKNEPAWMLEMRLAAFERWLSMEEPDWAKVHYKRVDYQDLYYYAAPKKKDGPKSLEESVPWIATRFPPLQPGGRWGCVAESAMFSTPATNRSPCSAQVTSGLGSGEGSPPSPSGNDRTP